MLSPTPSRALALSVWPKGISPVVQAVVLALLGTAVLVLSAKVKVPFYPVPMTLQTFAIMAIAATYGARLAVVTVLLYLFEGALGLPVFANTPPAIAGPAYFLGTTGGFLAGFIVLAWIVGTAADRGWDRSIGKLFAAMIVADIVVFALGFAWLAWFAVLPAALLQRLGLPADAVGAGAAFAWSQGVVPFLLADLLKIALAALAVPATWGLMERRT
jgi:biotin transport system substrate-specific component